VALAGTKRDEEFEKAESEEAFSIAISTTDLLYRQLVSEILPFYLLNYPL
jgi:hypothetical protein